MRFEIGTFSIQAVDLWELIDQKFREAWRDLSEALTNFWQLWKHLFPTDTVWDPYGAALVLVFAVLASMWLMSTHHQN